MSDRSKNIKMANCNCIKEANIAILSNTLNIKYGCNGTGKSTISRAIYLKAKNDIEGLNLLCPYKINPDDPELQPEIDDMTFSTVRVFDEAYVNSYLFKGESFLENSFQVFLRSDECDKLTIEIERLLSDLQGIFQQSESIQKLRAFLPRYFDAVKYSDGEISKRGGVGEFIKGNGGGFDKYEELKSYRPFYNNRDLISVSKWAKWRNDGIKQMNGESCPFCTSGLEMKEIEKQNKTISKVFKNSALSTANAVLEYIQEAVKLGYISDDSIKAMENYIGNSSKEDSLLAELQQLAIETDYISKKIEKICNFRPLNVNHDQLSNIEANLDDMIIDERQLLKFYDTKFILKMITDIKDKVLALKENTGKLKGLFVQHEQKIGKLIQDRKEDINHFLSLAGFPYKFMLKSNGEKQAVSYLVPVESNDENRIQEPEKHLSWGEKNAFSLVMFMFEAISDNADLIVLDDPITSFDKDKKFAVVRRLFDNQKVSFRDKTVIMLTHDMQPIIDYVYGGFFNRFGLTTPVKAQWLQNEDGLLKEHDIQSTDLLNTVDLTKKIAQDNDRKMVVRVVNLRKHIEIIKPNFSETPLYEVLSNLIHGRDIALSYTGEKLDPNVFDAGCKEMQNYFGNLSYDDVLRELTIEKLIEIINSTDAYGKIISIRLLFERSDGLLSKLRKKYPAACKYVNETNHVENDYIFQLNPFKYLSIPQFYMDQLEEFIASEKIT
jgi:ABC-type Mn2+/Zn2+ transport system ATPase subunit